MPKRVMPRQPGSDPQTSGFSDAFSTALDELKKARETDGAWLFPKGIDFVSLVVDGKNARVELKLSGSPQTAEIEVHTEPGTSLFSAVEFARAMERIQPPKPHVRAGSPTPAPPVTNIPTTPIPTPTLRDVASYWGDCCIGNDTFQNNCAHFLSDAFIRTGFSDLRASNSCIESGARCTPASRPVRARNMWCWFKSKASKTSSTPTRNTGWWGVFQLDESQYWGGHVALLDSDSWTYYGTGWYPDWTQYLYQW